MRFIYIMKLLPCDISVWFEFSSWTNWASENIKGWREMGFSWHSMEQNRQSTKDSVEDAEIDTYSFCTLKSIPHFLNLTQNNSVLLFQKGTVILTGDTTEASSGYLSFILKLKHV